MDGIRRAYNHVSIDDHSTNYNTDLTEALELGCMIDCAEAIIEGAILRTESRGAHYREDFPNRDDANWLAHSLVYKTSGGLELAKKPVTITIFEPKERKY
jgi:succinate dehydrogenase / fumarate reductase flavoprotein subunit